MTDPLSDNENSVQQLEIQIRALNKQISDTKEGMKKLVKLKDRQPLSTTLKTLRAQKRALLKQQKPLCHEVHKENMQKLVEFGKQMEQLRPLLMRRAAERLLGEGRMSITHP
jgi:predicted  nucleic acid-binding Zn-ribbon protein